MPAISGGVVPDVVTMNRAHSSHYTDTPDPRIAHVLRGWNPEGGAAEHHVRVGDVTIRNVPTDIRRFGQVMPDGNSIFIFEVAGLCIGHLGHLHHELGPEHIGWIGRLDIVMVPVDGSYTMAQASMINVIKLLRARIILPMHYFGPTTLGRFLDGLSEEFEVEISSSPEVVMSESTLPSAPTVLVLARLLSASPALEAFPRLLYAICEPLKAAAGFTVIMFRIQRPGEW
jgi:L-ascorbate metabolism protein UlaG (beta-lactamase superfamily)